MNIVWFDYLIQGPVLLVPFQWPFYINRNYIGLSNGVVSYFPKKIVIKKNTIAYIN